MLSNSKMKSNRQWLKKVIPRCLSCWTLTLVCVLPFALAQAQDSFAKDVRGYDVESLGWAVVMSLLGGALRTIFTLATDDHIVSSFGRETVKDGVVAMIAGALAYIVLEAFSSAKVLPVASEIRFAVIVFAGWSRMSFFGWLNKLGTRATEAVNERVAEVISSKSAPKPPAPIIAGNPVPPPAKPNNEVPVPDPKPKPFQEL